MFCSPQHIKMAVIWALGSTTAMASTPNWVREAATIEHQEYGPEVAAVCLLDEGRTEVSSDGEIRDHFRLAYRILTSKGLALAWVRLTSDGETRISGLKAWNLKPGAVHEVSQKDALETQLTGSEILFQDNKSLVLAIPQVEVGSVIAYEFERRHRPYILQNHFFFQGRYPVLRSRFELELPDGWEFTHKLLRHSATEPTPLGKNEWVWELADLAPVPDEEGSPSLVDLAARLSVSYLPPDKLADRVPVIRTWDDVARWADGLIRPQLAPSSEMAKRAAELAELDVVAEFVQKQIRYVAIEIGIGGYQPHTARETYQNRYGDCKDKVALLQSLLQTRDRELYPVLIHTQRRSLGGELPSPLHFNHMIAAIPVSEDEARQSPSVLEHPELGRLLLFDPTDSRTPFGRLPAQLQGTSALLLQGEHGYLIDTPVTGAPYNRLIRLGEFQLQATGRSSGNMVEMVGGALATRERSWLRGGAHQDWIRGAQRLIASAQPGALVSKFSVSGLEGRGFLREDYEIDAPYAVESAGDLLMFRPALLKEEPIRIPRGGDRQYDYYFPLLRLNTHDFRFRIPEGYVAADLPPVVELEFPFARYRMEIKSEEGEIRYFSTFEIRQLSVPAEAVPNLREFSDLVRRASNIVVLLKGATPE